MKKREYLSWHDFYAFLPTNLVLIHIQTPSDLTQTIQTIQTPQDLDIVMQYGALKENAISEYHGLISFLPTDLVLMPPETPSDPIQTLPDTIQTPQDIGIFMQYRALEEKAYFWPKVCGLLGKLDQGTLGMSDPSQVNLHQGHQGHQAIRTTRAIRATNKKMMKTMENNEKL